MSTEVGKVNGSRPAANIRAVPVSFRYPADRIALIDSISKRRGDADRGATIRHVLDSLIEEHFPGAIPLPAPIGQTA